MNRLETNLDDSSKSEHEYTDKKMGKVKPYPRMLHDIFYPPRITELSCFNLSALKNVTRKLKPWYAHILPKFMGIKDAYLFLRELEKVCSMMCDSNMPINTMRFKFIPCALKDQAKNWCIAYTQISLLIRMDLYRSFCENTSLLKRLLS